MDPNYSRKNGSIMLIIVTCYILFLNAYIAESFVGITWGRMQSQQLVPSMVVDLLLQNRVPELRLLTSGRDIVQAFANSNINITISIYNDQFKLVNTSQKAKEWVELIRSPIQKGVSIRNLHIGSDPFASSTLKRKNNFEAVDVMKHVQAALDRAGLGYIKTTIPHSMDIIKIGRYPSEAEIRDDIKQLVIDQLEFLRQRKHPFALLLSPIQHIKESLKVPLEFAFFDNNGEFKIQDGNITYSNVVEFMYDSVVCALSKVGYPEMEIIIAQIGWPTDGYEGATIKNAERFHRGLLQNLASKKGTPLRPGRIDAFLHSLSDENRFNIMYGPFQRHWGIYKADGDPKYKIDLSLQGRDTLPTQAKGTVKMPNRWCVFNGVTSDMDLVYKNMEKACTIGDCTSLGEGASCDKLDFEKNVSYAFNTYFQMKKQNIEECSFDGLGLIVPDNPSTPTCPFPVETLAYQDVVLPQGILLQA